METSSRDVHGGMFVTIICDGSDSVFAQVELDRYYDTSQTSSLTEVQHILLVIETLNPWFNDNRNVSVSLLYLFRLNFPRLRWRTGLTSVCIKYCSFEYYPSI